MVKKKIKKADKFVCRFCKREYVRETSMLNHACEKKRRWNQQDTRANRIAFMAWLEFMKTVSSTKKHDLPNYEKFIQSRLYVPFVRFGHHLIDLGAVNNNDYIQFLIKHNVKVADWVKDYPYETYIQNLNAKESPEAAIQRGLYLAEEWAIDNNSTMDMFFETISPNRALFWMSVGKISPWFLLASSKSHILLQKFTPEQHEQMNKYIDRGVWKVRIKKYKKEFNDIHVILKEHNL